MDENTGDLERMYVAARSWKGNKSTRFFSIFIAVLSGSMPNRVPRTEKLRQIFKRKKNFERTS